VQLESGLVIFPQGRGFPPRLAGGVARGAEGGRISPPACWGSTGEAGEGVGSSDASLWLASLAPPPGLRPYSPWRLRRAPYPRPAAGGAFPHFALASWGTGLARHGCEVLGSSLDFSPSLLGEWPGGSDWPPLGFFPSLLGEYRRSRGGGRFFRRKPLAPPGPASCPPSWRPGWAWSVSTSSSG